MIGVVAMYLYYDRISKMFSLQAEEEVLFLGPITHAQLKLKEYGCTASQAREAVLRAVFNMGDAVDLDNVKRMAKLINKNETRTKKEHN